MIGIAQVSPIDSGADALIGRGEIDERLEIEPSGGVRDQLARDQIDARVARGTGRRASFGSSR